MSAKQNETCPKCNSNKTEWNRTKINGKLQRYRVCLSPSCPGWVGPLEDLCETCNGTGKVWSHSIEFGSEVESYYDDCHCKDPTKLEKKPEFDWYYF
jgi:hypothetical protein